MDLKGILQAMWDYLPRLAWAAAIFLFGALAIHGVLRPLGRRLLRRIKWKPAVLSLALSMATAVAWILVISGIFAVLKLTVIAAALSGSLALVALAVAQGAKNTTADIVAGLFLAVDEDLDIGYRVTAGGVEGVVEKIDLRKTRIRDDEGKLHVVPNRAVEGGAWVVHRRDEG